MKKKYITKLMIAACLSSALSLNSCIEEVFPESSTATIDQIGKSDQAISAMVNSVVAFINAFRSYGPQFYHDFGYSGPQIRDFPHEVLQTEEKCAFD